MTHSLIVAVAAGLLGMFGWGLADFFAKKTIDEIGDVASLAWGHMFGTIVLAIIVLFEYFFPSYFHGYQAHLPTHLNAWLLLFVFGAAQAIIYLLVYRGFSKGQIAILNPVFASFTGITAFLSIVVFGEIVSVYIIPCLLIIFAGIILINVDIGALVSRKLAFTHVPGFKEIAIATLGAAVWTLMWDRFVSGQDWLMYALLMYAFMTVVILVYAFSKKVSLRVQNVSVWKFLLFIGLGEIVAYVGLSFGYSTTSLTSVIALLSGAFSLPTIVLAYLFLNEKITRTQRIGSMVIIVGIILVALI